MISSCPAPFEVLSGDDSFTLPLLALGGHGAICVTSNVAPREMVSLYEAVKANDLPRAREIHYRLQPLFDILFCETNPIPVKAALELMGQVGSEIRLPLTKLLEANRERVQIVLKEVGIL